MARDCEYLWQGQERLRGGMPGKTPTAGRTKKVWPDRVEQQQLRPLQRYVYGEAHGQSPLVWQPLDRFGADTLQSE